MPARQEKRPDATPATAFDSIAARSVGWPLEPAARREMEARFGHDFSQVRVHTDAQAAEVARRLDANAVTRGQDIYFAAGRYQPATDRNRALLAHELAHTIQQRQQTALQASATLSQPGDALEAEADAAASQVAAGLQVRRESLSVGALGAANVLARQPATLAPLPASIERDATPRVELLDPAQMIDALARIILRNLQDDPDDRSGRVRLQMRRLAPSTRESVLERLRRRLTDAQWDRLTMLVAESPPDAGEIATPPTGPEPDAEPVEEAAAVEEATGAEQTPGVADKDTSMAGAQTPAAEAVAGERQAGEADGEPTAEPGPNLPQVDAAEVEQMAGEEGMAAPEAAAAPATPVAPATPASAPGAAAAPEGSADVAEDVLQSETPVPLAEDDTGAGAESKTGVSDSGTIAAGAEVEPDPQVAAEPEPPQDAVAAAGESEVASIPSTEESEGESVSEADRESETVPPPTNDESSEPASESTPQPISGSPSGVTPEAEPDMDQGTADEGETDSGEQLEPQTESFLVAERVSAALEVERDSPNPGAPTPQAIAPSISSETAIGVGDQENPVAETIVDEEAGVNAIPAETPSDVPISGAGASAGPGGEADVSDDDAGGACGGGGEPIQEQEPPEAPDVSQADPAHALETVGNLPPAQLQGALGSVAGAASGAVGEQRQELAANPPEMERPSGVPSDRDASVPPQPPPTLPADAGPRSVERAPQGEAQPTPAPPPIPAPPAAPTQSVSEPRVPGEAQLSEQDVRQVQQAVRSLPTTDPALHVTVDPAPRLQLEGNADPARAREQRADMSQGVRAAHEHGTQDAATPLGEHNVYPHVPPETLQAGIPGGNGTDGVSGGAAVGGREATDEITSIVAQQERGAEIRAAVGSARADMVAGREEHAQTVTNAREESQGQIDEAVRQNADSQTAERARAREDVQRQRNDWANEQRELVDSAHTEADEAGRNGEQNLRDEQSRAERDANQHVQTGNQEIATARRDGEASAARKRREAERESSKGGFFSWLGSKVTSFFNGIKEGIRAAFDLARRVVRAAIEKAQRLATAAIEAARQAAVGIIRRVGDALIAIGDRVLAGFPGLRDRFRRAIQERVARAEEAVNRLADRLKDGVVAALNFLGRALDAALGLLERAYLAAIDIVAQAVQGAIQFAKSVVQGLAAFAALIKDIAANPTQWLSNLGKAAIDGVRNCLWVAFKRAVKNWFNQKLEEVLGLGLAVWNLLRNGGIALAQIGRMAWEGLKAAIPVVLIQLLIEKLVAMIIPAAGAILTIIEGLRAAWGTVSRIITAFQLFFAFLKAVREGGASAAGKFANAVAAAAVVVIDFVANWLLMRLRKPAGAIAGRLRGIAQKLGTSLRRIGRAARRGTIAVGRYSRRGLARAGASLERSRDRFRSSRARRQRRRDPQGSPTERARVQSVVRAIVEAADRRNKPVRALLRRLDRLRRRHRWIRGFQATPKAQTTHFAITMFASEISIATDYTEEDPVGEPFIKYGALSGQRATGADALIKKPIPKGSAWIRQRQGAALPSPGPPAWPSVGRRRAWRRWQEEPGYTIPSRQYTDHARLREPSKGDDREGRGGSLHGRSQLQRDPGDAGRRHDAGGRLEEVPPDAVGPEPAQVRSRSWPWLR
jgi:phage-related protein